MSKKSFCKIIKAMKSNPISKRKKNYEKELFLQKKEIFLQKSKIK